MSKKGGYYCAFKNCRGLSRRDKRSFFRFPKDPKRSKQWVKACDRDDLLEKTPIELFNSYRVCAKHFTDSMFLNDLRNRLQPNSVPVQWKSFEISDDGVQTPEKVDELCTDEDPVTKILSNCVLHKISADEFFKATGICVNESDNAIKAAEGYLLDSSLPDHNFSKSKMSGDSPDIGKKTLNNFTIGSLSYQDFINSLPASLISAPNTESLSLENNLSFIISDKTIEIEELPENIMEEQDALSTITTESFLEPMDGIFPVESSALRNVSEESTQTEFDFKDKADSTCQTETISSFDILEESAQTNADVTIAVARKSTENSGILQQTALKNVPENQIQKVDLEIEYRQHFSRIMDDITLEEFELLTEKFFPKETSDFIKIQAQLFKRKNRDRKYSIGLKKQCLSLFSASPRIYKNLQKIFCLPAIRDLQSLKL